MTQATIDVARQAYDRQGFYMVDLPALPMDAVRAAADGMDAVRRGEYETGTPPAPSPWNPGDDPDALCKIEMPQFSNLAIRGLIASPVLGEWAAKITGASMVQVWWAQLLYKPSLPHGAAAPTHVGWHQDMQYWAEWRPGSELFTAWVALADVPEDAGPMRFVPGSHKWGVAEGGDFFGQDMASQKNAIAVPEGEQWTEVLDDLPAGGFSFHDCLTIHGSGANHSGQPRRSFAIHLRTENATLNPDADRVLTRFLDDTELCPVIHGERK
jgi:ectoine hydroxylase-related dioxygenase (phytanoyl-CoA dioxygenase family)